MLTSYRHEVFDGLYTFDAAKQQLEENEQHLEKIGSVICQHGLEKHVGVSLLHQHFPLNSHEYLVERVVEGKTRIEPLDRERDSENVSPYMWKVERNTNTGTISWVPLEFMRSTDFPISDISERQAFLEDVANRIIELGLEQSFGISLAHRHVITTSDEQMLVETSSRKSRFIEFAPMIVKEIDRNELLPTFWTFTPLGGADVGFACKGCCNGCCGNHPD